ncbi:LON peptidase substrate-binding domain-containing protein [Magnetovibrio blakemorei]|uniref:Lon N-terminal domain-containing protein n=1 Tax=Magnetovibrio blakemorei TaxID=28181 RepID=A0A1E5Q3S8_9PROT|nr:LON peptidase substrate-binding domain-containing protein [Magnetovibrio blakemorei]OEJ64144.1 hypothetical protein BEN30_01515 [Magnetovibrio blakemorei]
MSRARNAFHLPQRLAVFPLPGTVLMPYGHLPLNIFEPRYIHMIDDALGKGRIIGMIQPRQGGSDLVADDALLYDVGTAGRIIQFHDSGDGRYLITLEGLSRFRFQADIASDPARGYRWVEADYSLYEDDLNVVDVADEPGRERLLELMSRYFGKNDIDADWNAVSQAPYEALVASLSMSCPFAPQEKQALLECPTFQDRARMLISLFEMSGDTNASPALRH